MLRRDSARPEALERKRSRSIFRHVPESQLAAGGGRQQQLRGRLLVGRDDLQRLDGGRVVAQKRGADGLAVAIDGEAAQRSSTRCNRGD